MTNKEAFNKIMHHINGTKLSSEEYIECCKQIINSLERLEELEKSIDILKKKSYEITLKEFFGNKKRIGIHCSTEEQANILLKAFDKLGEMWCDDKLYIDDNRWNYYKSETVYYNDNRISDLEFARYYKYKVYKFDEVDLGGK